MNRYPLWKNILILAVALVGLLFSLPNVFPQDPSIEVTGARGVTVDDSSIVAIRACGVHARAGARRGRSRVDAEACQPLGLPLICAARSRHRDKIRPGSSVGRAGD